MRSGVQLRDHCIIFETLFNRLCDENVTQFPRDSFLIYMSINLLMDNKIYEYVIFLYKLFKKDAKDTKVFADLKTNFYRVIVNFFIYLNSKFYLCTYVHLQYLFIFYTPDESCIFKYIVYEYV